jgi:hypothetical protein
LRFLDEVNIERERASAPLLFLHSFWRATKFKRISAVSEKLIISGFFRGLLV